MDSESLKQIIAVGGGKGGVGKSVITANLGIALANAGKKVICIDLDLGGSNLHSIFGMTHSGIGFGDFLYQPGTDINDILTTTFHKNLHIITSDGNLPGVANIRYFQKLK